MNTKLKMIRLYLGALYVLLSGLVSGQESWERAIVPYTPKVQASPWQYLFAGGLPGVSYSVPSSLTVGSTVHYAPTHSGGTVYGSNDVTTFAGSGSQGSANGTGSSASFYSPRGVAVDAVGNVYVADALNHKIRKISPAGVVSTHAGTGAVGAYNALSEYSTMNTPSGVAVDGFGNVYFADRGNHMVRKITAAGMVDALAGYTTAGDADGTGIGARFSSPSDVAVDALGNVYVADEGNHRIRKVSPAGSSSTLAGSIQGISNGTGTAARFSSPKGVAVDAEGNVYVADYGNHLIRKISPSGLVSTYAGTGVPGATDGMALSASFYNPYDVSVDLSGTVYVVDGNRKVRKISPAGLVSTVAGTGGSGVQNGNPLSATFNGAEGVCSDALGHIYVADAANNRIRKIGGAAGFTISPALPAGLFFNPEMGVISGTPMAPHGHTSYTIAAHSEDGSSSTTVSFAVTAGTPALSGERNYILKKSYLSPFGSMPDSPVPSAAMQAYSYFDGLGRPLQQVAVRASPGADKDIVTPQAYDYLGRQDKSYLPYATATGAGGTFKTGAVAAQSSYYSSTPPLGQSSNAYAYSRTIFEPSPLDRVLEQGYPGQAWQPSASRGSTGRTLLSDRQTNNTEAFSTIGSSTRATHYSVDLSGGSPVLVNNGAYPAGSLYVSISKDENWLAADGRTGTVEEYTDKQGKVILKRAFNKQGSTAEMLSTYYVYDDLGNLSFVLPPGLNPDRDAGVPTASELEQFAYRYRYDARQRMVEKQLPGKGREYLVYNKLDQLVATQDANQRAAGQWSISKYDGLGRNILSGTWLSTGTRESVQVSVDAQSGSNHWEERTGKGYSNRSWPTSAVDVLQQHYYDDYAIAGLPTTGITGYSPQVQGLSTASRISVLGTSDYLWNINYYDDKGQLSRQYTQHYKGGAVSAANYDAIENVYDFSGLITASTRRHYAGSSSPAVTLTTEYSYDHQQRLIDTWKTVNSGTRTLISRNEYNDIGQLVNKKLHSTDGGGSFGQAVAYTYNPRGWLSSSTAGHFSQTLKYNEGTSPQYNGNISAQEWKHGSGALESYSYTYDRLNRLIDGQMPGGLKREALSYDPMGNILSLQRDAGAAWNYAYSGNKLSSISGGISTVSYGYDANGNMTTDGRTGNSYSYNQLNLIATASAGGGISYTYDANGRKLRTSVGSAVTDYIDGIEWEGTTLNLIHMEEGRIINTGSGYAYEYMLRDHLGNTRSGFASDALGTAKFRSDYYPFGLAFNSGATGSPKNRYLYTGKELQDGTEFYDYGARQYDPVIGRWNAVDPMGESYHGWSSYNYGLNDPINKLDPNGMWVEHSNGWKTDDEDEIEKLLKKLREANSIAKQNANLLVNTPGTIIRKDGSGSLVRSTLQKGDASTDALMDNAFDLGIGFTPVGTFFDVKAALTGEDMSGEELSPFWRVAGLVPFMSEFKKGNKVLKAASTFFGKEVAEIAPRIGKKGEAIEVLFKDGSKIDINAARVKEWVPNIHPKAPSGTLQKVKFDNSLPGSKGYKREATQAEIEYLKKLLK